MLGLLATTISKRVFAGVVGSPPLEMPNFKGYAGSAFF
jgi:hypothetical protein